MGCRFLPGRPVDTVLRMTSGDWVTILSSSVLASVLLNAGLAKLVSPAGLVGALDELLPVAFAVPARAVRVLAGVEVLVALGLVAAPTRPLASVAAGGLGCLFAGAGLAGWRRGSQQPCGCMGGGGGRPLGAANVALGLALAAMAAVGLLAGAPAASAADLTAWAAALTSAGSLLLSVWTSRDLARSLLLPGAASIDREATE